MGREPKEEGRNVLAGAATLAPPKLAPPRKPPPPKPPWPPRCAAASIGRYNRKKASPKVARANCHERNFRALIVRTSFPKAERHHALTSADFTVARSRISVKPKKAAGAI